ncbi:MAG TPA: NUDIX hydrolase [Bacillales bacterium]|nr:NUDIX hydrolase [Bacillales bacterium]
MDYIRYLRSMVGKKPVIMVTAGAFIFDGHGRVLLHLRTDNGTWAHPGGFMELGESAEETARREVFEETGLTAGPLELFGIYSGPEKEHTMANGDQVFCVDVLYTCKKFSGTLKKVNEESLDAGFFALDALPKPLFADQQEEFSDLLSSAKPPFSR